MIRLTLLLPSLLILAASANLAAASQRAGWMKEARWGVMSHYLADWITHTHKIEMSVEEWNRRIDAFDVEGLAKQLESAGAGYYLLTIGQNSGYYLSPNATYDRLAGITPSKCSRRDLIADLSAALSRRGIRLMVYLPSGAPDRDAAACAALGWSPGPKPNREFQLKWEQVIREWSLRWGTKIAGWWFDGCYYPNSMYRSPKPPNFSSIAASARAGNPASALAFNPGVVYRILSMTPEEDYTAGEIDQPDRVSVPRAADGMVDGVRVHMLTYLGKSWAAGEPRFTPQQAAEISLKFRERGGVITWDTPLQLNGTFAPTYVEQLNAVGKALAAK